MENSTFDPVPYITETRFNAVSAQLVITRLSRTAPTDLMPPERKLLRQMEAARKEVQRVREDRTSHAPAKVRPVLQRVNVAWGGFSHSVAASVSLLDDLGGVKRERAVRVQGSLFPETGGPDLNVDAATAYVDAQARIERIASAGLEADVIAVVGREHYDAVITTTAELGEALGVGEAPRSLPNGTALASALRAASHAVAHYAWKLLGAVDSDDPATIDRFVNALAPLIEHKVSRGRGANAVDPTATAADAGVTNGASHAVATTPVAAG